MKSTEQKINEIIGSIDRGVSWANLRLDGNSSAIAYTKQRLEEHLQLQGSHLLGDLRSDNEVGVAYGQKEDFSRGLVVKIGTNYERTTLVVQYMGTAKQSYIINELYQLKRAVPEFMYAQSPSGFSIEEILREQKAA